MSAAVVPASGALRSNPNFDGGDQSTASDVNAYRVGVIAEKLDILVQPGKPLDAKLFFQLCLSLARGIDYAVANNHVPALASTLPPLLKKVCQGRNEFLLQAAIMVLMVSAKNACKIGWFASKETEDLLTLANEVGSKFNSAGDVFTEPTAVLPVVSSIMTKFYPRFKLGHILASLEVKPGYGTYVVDFHISKSLPHSPEDRIRLFVAQKDNTDTSSCIISPTSVSFLLNGKGVERRTNIMPDQGPQLPTVVNTLLKYGTNILQLVGQFDGHYVILVAFMGMKRVADLPTPPDYVQPVAATSESDSEIIEGPSRISLNCPISRKRIQMPVKGHLCKHHQCFDLTNYIDINLRRPSWRCAHCNQSVCYADLRVDRKMLKILQEVGEKVVDVIISADGSWRAASKSEVGKDEPNDKVPNGHQEGKDHKSSPVPVDLTEADDEMHTIDTCEPVDRKPVVHDDIQNPSVTRNAPEVNRSTGTHAEASIRSGTYLSNSASVNYVTTSDAQNVPGTSGPPPATIIPSPVYTSAVSTALNRGAEAFQSIPLTTSMMANQFQAINNNQLQQLSRYGPSIGNNEFARFTPATRSPTAIQALPVPMPAPVPTPAQSPQQLFRPNNLAPNGSSVMSQAFPSPTSLPNVARSVRVDQGRQHPVSPSSNPLNVRGHTTPVQLPNAYRASSGLRTEHPQQTLNLRMPQTMSQPPHLMRSTQGHRGVSPTGTNHTSSNANVHQLQYMNATALQAAQRGTQLTRQLPTMPLHLPNSRSATSMVTPMDIDRSRAALAGQRGNALATNPQSVSRAENLIDLQSEDNWRPSGRMRGSLSGRAYSEALSQLIIQPSQPVPQTPRPASTQTAVPSEPDRNF